MDRAAPPVPGTAPLRVLHLSGNSYPPLPAEHHTRRIWRELARDGIEHHVLARAESGHASTTRDAGTTLHLLPSLVGRMAEFMVTSWALPWLVRRLRPDRLLVQCPVVGGLAAAACARWFQIPLIVELHGTHYFGPPTAGWRGRVEFGLYRRLSMPAFRAASTIRCLSAGMATGLRRVYGDRIADKAVVVPTRVDLGVFSRPKDDWSTGAGLKLITVGACSPTKNHLALIRALAAWGRPFHLTIVGTGPLRDHYLSLGRQLGCAEALRLIGPIPHDALAAELVKHDVYVHYSLAEGLPRAVLEAMACALPVVCTRVGFLSDLAGEGGDEAPAILLDPPWAEGLHRALTLLADSPHQRRDRGLALRRQVEADFDADQVFERYRALIRAGRSCTA